jgi:heptosyltransferase-2
MTKPEKKILIRLPNWLGDMVMSTLLLEEVFRHFPGSPVGLIVKKGLEGLVEYFPGACRIYTFSKKEYPGLRGVWKFGRSISREKWDIYISLPDSLSAAVMGLASGAPVRVGYRSELRSFLLSHAYKKEDGLHRTDSYRFLLFRYLKLPLPEHGRNYLPVKEEKSDYLVVNINSEAISRRLPVSAALLILKELLVQFNGEQIILVGGPGDITYVEAVYRQLPPGHNVVNRSGQTSLKELTRLIAGARAMLSSDSGPAHIAVAVGTPLVVLFGAGDEKETGPYHAETATVIRLGQLPCEPCRKNTCQLAELPPCLLLLDPAHIADAVKQIADAKKNTGNAISTQ